jgi:hypothetical protein
MYNWLYTFTMMPMTVIQNSLHNEEAKAWEFIDNLFKLQIHALKAA